MLKLFTASWCKYCQPVKKMVEERGLLVQIVDIDHSPELAIQAKVKQIPALQMEDGSIMLESQLITEYLLANAPSN